MISKKNYLESSHLEIRMRRVEGLPAVVVAVVCLVKP